MIYKISYERKALLELRSLEYFIASRIVKKIKLLNKDSFNKIKRLKNRNEFSLRVGDYRVLMEIEEDNIKILKIGHRKNIYER